MDIFYNILLFFAGLGVFIFAIDMMGKNMQTLFGSAIRGKLQKLSNKPVLGAFMGTGGTIALQSSTAMIVLLISFVQIGVLSVIQSLPIVIGINVGASVVFVTLLASAFNLSIVFSSMALIGAFVNIFAKSTKIKAVGNVLFAFGILFLGLYLISFSMNFLKSLDFVNNFLATTTNPLILVLLGICLSLLTQSSLATNAIIISLCAGVGGDIGFAIQSALWVSVGSRIGPTGAGILASIGKYKSAKMVALFNLFFNLCSLVLFSLSTLTGWMGLLDSMVVNPVIIIVLVNIIMSSVNGLLLFFFVKPISKVLPKLFVNRRGVKDIYEIEEGFFEYPEMCMGQIGKQFESLLLAQTDNLQKLMAYCLNEDETCELKVIENNNNELYNCIDKVKLNLTKLNQGLSDNQKDKLYFYIDMIGRFHSLADRAYKIIALFPKKPTKQFTKEQISLTQSLFDEIMQLNKICKEVVCDINDGNEIALDVATNVFEIEKRVANKKLELKEMIIERYNDAISKSNITDKYSRFINQLEQIGEHYSAVCLLAFGNVANSKNDKSKEIN